MKRLVPLLMVIVSAFVGGTIAYDLAADGTHASESGRRKVANMLHDYFTTDALAKSWFTTR